MIGCSRSAIAAYTGSGRAALAPSRRDALITWFGYSWSPGQYTIRERMPGPEGYWSVQLSRRRKLSGPQLIRYSADAPLPPAADRPAVTGFIICFFRLHDGNNEPPNICAGARFRITEDALSVSQGSACPEHSKRTCRRHTRQRYYLIHLQNTSVSNGKLKRWFQLKFSRPMKVDGIMG